MPVIIGTSGDDSLEGGTGSDSISGLGGNDTLVGSSGDDTLNGGAGADTMYGGAGSDSYYVDDAGDVVNEQTVSSTDVDTVYTTIDFALSGAGPLSAGTQLIENLTYIGSGDFHGVGNGLNNVVTGGAGNDTLEGSSGTDTLIGGAGNDIYIVDYSSSFFSTVADIVVENAGEGTDAVRTTRSSYTLEANVENLEYVNTLGGNFLGVGNELANQITGGGGADALNGAGGVDTLIGGLGDDTYTDDDGLDAIIELAGQGTDTVRTAASSYTLHSANVENLTYTGSGAFNGAGDSSANFITGGAGADTLDGGGGADTLSGGNGADVYIVNNTGVTIVETGSPQVDTLMTSLASYSLAIHVNVENLTFTGTGAFSGTGNANNNLIIGGSGNDVLDGGNGADTLDGGAGRDTMIGGAGNDTFIVDDALDVVTEATPGGDDTIKTTLASYSLASLTNIESLTYIGASSFTGSGNAAANILTGGANNDVLNGAAGADTMIGAGGSDTYYVDSAGDVIVENASEGADTAIVSVDGYTLSANVENLELGGTGNFAGTGNGLNNQLIGNAGNNILDGGLGADSMLGGAGGDVYFVDDAGDVIVENANEGADQVKTTLANYTLTDNVEKLSYLGGAAFTGAGNALDNNLVGGGAADTLSGGLGADTLDGGAGADSLIGGDGDDLYVVDAVGDEVVEDSGAGTDTIQTSLSSYSLSSLSNVEHLTYSGSGAFAGVGNAGANILTGGLGADTLTGGAGADSLYGGGGADTAIYSGARTDYYITAIGGGAYSVTDLRAGSPDGVDYLSNIESAQFTDGTISLLEATKVPSALVGPLHWLTSGTTTNATWSSDEVDVYRVVLQAGHTYTFSLNGAGGGLDPALSLLNSGLTVVASNDDVAYPSNLNSSITYTAISSGEYYLGAYEVNSQPGAYSLSITDSSASDTILSTAATSQSVAIGGASVNSTIAYAGDHDWVRVTLTAGQSYVFTMNGSGGTPLTDPFLALRDSSGALVAFDDDGGSGTNAQLQFTATASGTYYLDASAYAQETGGYTLSAATGAAQNPLNTLDLGFTINHQNITVYFATGGESFGSIYPGSETSSRSWTAGEITAAFAALNTISAATNLTFTQVGSASGADFIVSLADLGSGTLGLTYTNGGSQALVEFDPNGAGWTAGGLQAGGYGFITLVHEFGHALGLDHPHYDGGDVQVMQGVLDSFNYYGTFGLDQGVFTTMGYNDGWPTGPNGLSSSYSYGWQSGLMALDVAALQLKYGANATANSGDTTYNMATANTTGTRYQTIWDTGGTDTIAYGGSANATIDLRAATLLSAPGGGGFVSYASGIIGGFTIASGAVIENATGGGGNDRLTGNDAANILNGGAGADTMAGGAGDDVYVVDNALDVVTEAASAGSDTVQVTLALYTLSASVEKLTFIGSGNFNGAGNAQDNLITGGSGDDRLYGAGGADTLIGGAGADTYAVDDLLDTLTENSGEGTDTVRTSLMSYTLAANIENLTLTGGAASSGTGNGENNYLLGNAAANTLTGLVGADTLYGAGGADTLIGGTGNDTYLIDAAGVVTTELSGEGTDLVRSSISWTLGANIENLTLTGAAANNGFGNAENNLITGNAGANVLKGSGGDDTLDGAGGNDTVSYTGAGGAVTASLLAGTATGEGSDTLISIENLTGSIYNDVLTGDANANVLNGYNGNDTLNGGLGADTLAGGAGDDVYIADSSDVIVEAVSGGTDTIRTMMNTYTLAVANVENVVFTGAGAVTLTGNAGANVLTGGAGGDTFRTGGGADTLIGGDGDDLYVISQSGVTITEASGEGTDTVRTSLTTYTLGANVENLILVNEAVNGIGNSENNEITGHAGANTLSGLDGNDTLRSGGGADTLIGGAGDDLYVIAGGAAVVTELGGEGTDTVRTSLTTYTLEANVENLVLVGDALNGFGNSENNQITGNANANVLKGFAGDDTLDGAGGNDTVSYTAANGAITVSLAVAGAQAIGADQGSDTLISIENLTGSGFDDSLTGNSGANVLNGYNGADTLYGGLGADTLVGGAGADVFVFNTALGAGNVDRITDFVHGVDQIQLDHAIFAAAGAAGALSAGAFYAGAAAHDADDRILYNSATGALLYDADGNGGGAAIQFATLTTGLTLTNTDFLVI